MPDFDCCTDDQGDRADLDRMAGAIMAAIPGATVTITPESVGKCRECLGDGVVPIVDGYSDSLTECARCGGSGWAPTADVDDADHAEYVDPIDHSHDVPTSSATAAERLAAVLNIHRRNGDHVCAAEPFYPFPCPTARATLGIIR